MTMANPAHVGEIISEVLKTMGLTRARFAELTGVAPKTAAKILNGEKEITQELAFKLELIIGSTAETWLNIQKAHDLARLNKSRLSQ